MPPTCIICGGLHHARGYCRRHYGHRHQHGQFADTLEHPRRIVGRVALASCGIRAETVARRCADAATELAATTTEALLIGAAWRESHPEQFSPEAVRAVFRDPAGLAVSVWADQVGACAA